MLHSKKQLDITLTEPVVFLRSFDPSGRHSDPNDSPTIVRGVLTLNVLKPIDISSIDVELSGALTTLYSEGVASRRTDIQETYKIYSSTVTVFRADHTSRGGLALPAQNATNSVDHLINLSHPVLSPRGPSERPNIVIMPPDFGPTPPYSRAPPSPDPAQLGDNSADLLQELGQTLRDTIEVYRDGSPVQPQDSRSSRPHSIAFCHSNSTTHSAAATVPSEPFFRESGDPPSADGTSLPNSTQELSPTLLRQSSHPRSHSYPRGNNPDVSNLSPAPSRLRLSINNVLGIVREVASRTPSQPRNVTVSEEGERGRTRVRVVSNEQDRENAQMNGVMSGAGNRQPQRANTCPGHERHFLGLGRILGLERDSEREKDSHQKSKDCVEGWKEFRPGTYSYPISFLLPCNLPPTFSTPRGSLNYIIKAVAHRPGTFTSKLSCQIPLLVVAAPTPATGEGGVPGDPGPLNVERHWEEKLAYSLDLSSRLFLLGSQRRLGAGAGDAIGESPESSGEATAEARTEAQYGTAVLNLTLLPLEKVKIWRLSIVIDQHISYFDGRNKRLRDEEKGQVKLLDVQDKCLAEELGLGHGGSKQKKTNGYVQIPLLPTPISPDRSPLLRHISPSTDPSVLAGPGPYTISTTIGLPHCRDRGLRFSMKHETSYVKVEHFLRLVMRVENVGDESIKEVKKFDVTVQTPITVLSCRCVPEQQSLPVYSPATEECLACPCRPGSVGSESGHGHEAENEMVVTSTPKSEDRVGQLHREGDVQRWRHERSRSSSRTRPYATHVHSRGQHQDQSYAVTATLSSTPQSSRPPSPLSRYERLVSGLESEVGEVPPSYESVTARCL